MVKIVKIKTVSTYQVSFEGGLGASKEKFIGLEVGQCWKLNVDTDTAWAFGPIKSAVLLKDDC